jgi:hypothetical protein
MLDPAVTVLQGSHKDLRILSDTRTQKDTLETFGGEYPGGALYSTVAWINGHETETQALTNAMLATNEGILKLSGRWHEWRSADGALEIPAMPTLHPAFLLRQPTAKKRAWSDLLTLEERLDRRPRPA